MNIQHMPGQVKSVIRGVPYILGIIDFSVPVGLGVGWEQPAEVCANPTVDFIAE